MSLAILEEQELLRRTPTSTDWREVVAKVDALPSLPSVSLQALQLIDDPKSTGAQLTTVIGRDVGLAARVLRIANSALFMRAAAVTTLLQATTLLGFHTLRGIVLAASLARIQEGSHGVSTMLWQHAVGVALVARYLAQELKRADVDEVFLCGLLHNVGQVLFAISSPEEYGQVLEEIEIAECEYPLVEERVLHVAHPILGALLLRRWNFSPHFARVVMSYTDPFEKPLECDATFAPKVEIHAQLVRAADMLCHSAKIGTPRGYPVDTQALGIRLVGLGLHHLLSDTQGVDALKCKARELFERDFMLYH